MISVPSSESLSALMLFAPHLFLTSSLNRKRIKKRSPVGRHFSKPFFRYSRRRNHSIFGLHFLLFRKIYIKDLIFYFPALRVLHDPVRVILDILDNEFSFFFHGVLDLHKTIVQIMQ